MCPFGGALIKALRAHFRGAYVLRRIADSGTLSPPRRQSRHRGNRHSRATPPRSAQVRKLLYDGAHLVDTFLRRLILVVYFLPCIVVVIIRGVGSAYPGVVGRGITDARQGAIAQQMRYVAHIARVYLFVSVGNGGILLCPGFQLKNTKGYAVDVRSTSGMRTSF